MIQIVRRSYWWRGILAVIVSAPLLTAGLVFWRAAHAKEEAAAEVLSNSEFAFRILPVERTAPQSVDPVAAVPGYCDVATYKDTVVASARAGIFVYDRGGTLLRMYRTGIELPPAEPGAMAVGIAAGSAAPELFIATRGEGMLIFDGARFRQLLPAETDLRSVTSLLVTGSGRILLGTERAGLLSFDGRRLAPFHPRLKNIHITALAGNDGNLWIGSLADGLFHYRGGQLEELLSSLPDPRVLSLAVREDYAYAGTPIGVVEFRDGIRQRILADGFFARALDRRADTLLVGTEDEGIAEVPLHTRPAPGRDSSAMPPIVRLATLEGDAYAVAENAVYRFDPGVRRWRPVLGAAASVLADRNVSALALHDGRLWVGYFDRGLDIVDAALEHAEHHEDDTLFCVNRIVAGPHGSRTAVATANGLVMFDAARQPRQVMGRKDGLLADHVTDIAFREGGMVAATPAGLSFVDRTGVRSLYVFHGLVNNHVYTVATEGAHTAAGTLGGLSLLDDDIVRANYTTANSHLKHNWITALARVGDDWFVGTYGAGVLRLDRSGEWHAFPDLKEGFVVNPNAMTVSGGKLYAGTLDRGLLIFDRASARWTAWSPGLPSRNVTALAVGGGYLYAGTDNGLVRIAEGVLR